MRPVVVWPEISSPAQSFASVMNVPSNSCFPCRAAFCSFCLGSLGASSGSLRQQRYAAMRHNDTTANPAMNVMIDERRKHHHFRTLRHSTSSGSDAVVVSSSDEAIPLGREASSQACHAPAITPHTSRACRRPARDWAAPRTPPAPGRCRAAIDLAAPPHYRPLAPHSCNLTMLYSTIFTDPDTLAISASSISNVFDVANIWSPDRSNATPPCYRVSERYGTRRSLRVRYDWARGDCVQMYCDYVQVGPLQTYSSFLCSVGTCVLCKLPYKWAN